MGFGSVSSMHGAQTNSFGNTIYLILVYTATSNTQAQGGLCCWGFLSLKQTLEPMTWSRAAQCGTAPWGAAAGSPTGPPALQPPEPHHGSMSNSAQQLKHMKGSYMQRAVAYFLCPRGRGMLTVHHRTKSAIPRRPGPTGRRTAPHSCPAGGGLPDLKCLGFEKYAR